MMEFGNYLNNEQVPGYAGGNASVAVTVFPFESMKVYRSYINDKQNVKLPKTKEALLQSGLRSKILALLTRKLPEAI